MLTKEERAKRRDDDLAAGVLRLMRLIAQPEQPAPPSRPAPTLGTGGEIGTSRLPSGVWVVEVIGYDELGNVTARVPLRFVDTAAEADVIAHQLNTTARQ